VEVGAVEVGLARAGGDHRGRGWDTLDL
jgi:hypothetical protein